MTGVRTRLACAACAVLVVVLAQTPVASALRSVREKQVKLEDIERDNLQSELQKQQPSHPAYHSQQQQQQQQQEQAQEQEQAYHPQHYHPQQHQHLQQQQQQHYRFEQLAAPQQQHLLQDQHAHRHLQRQQHQQHLLYQAAASAGPAAPIVPTHVMYLLMPNGNVAAFQLAPHPNHIQAYYTPSGKAHLQPQMSLGTLFHQHAPIPMAYLQPQLAQHPVQPQVQYVPAALPLSQHAPHAQRYHPTVHHQPTLSFNSPQAHQLHAQHFSSLAPSQHSLLFRELAAEPSPASGIVSAGSGGSGGSGPEISTYSQPAELPQQPQQSIKSLFGAGVKATASPPLKGSFSTQTGQSYANFRQYG